MDCLQIATKESKPVESPTARIIKPDKIRRKSKLLALPNQKTSSDGIMNDTMTKYNQFGYSLRYLLSRQRCIFSLKTPNLLFHIVEILLFAKKRRNRARAFH